MQYEYLGSKKFILKDNYFTRRKCLFYYLRNYAGFNLVQYARDDR